ncbi:hypothetical protein AB0K09_07990 [Streptomyces sp. NPDC049577]|uniref:hypothetical protein n=1 Tax=Streptomyces sp. NPDC049577 TaxID=3155153 RepID=UPI003437E09C
MRIHPLAAALAHTQLTRPEEDLTGRQAVAARMCVALDGVPGIHVPELPVAARASRYAPPLRYEPAELGGLPIERFLYAVHAGRYTGRPAGIDLPAAHPSTVPDPRALLPGYADRQDASADGFPVAE